MTTYAVFGMTPHRALDIARDRTPIKGLSEAEWWKRVQHKRDEIMASDEVAQLSCKYDAPQFAADYMDLARRYGGVRLHVLSHAQTGGGEPYRPAAPRVEARAAI